MTTVKSGKSPNGVGFAVLPRRQKWKNSELRVIWVGKLNRADEHPLVINDLTRPGGADRKQFRYEKWNLGSAKAVLSRILGLKANADIDTSVARQEYITNQVLDEHAFSTCYSRGDGDTEAHCRTRFESIWIKEFAEAEVANRTVDVVPIDPNVRSSEPVEPAAAVGGQPAAMEKDTTNDQAGTRKLVRNTVVERDGRAPFRWMRISGTSRTCR